MIVKSFGAGLVYNRDAEKFSHFIQAAAVDPVSLKKQLLDVLFPNDGTDVGKRFLWKLKTASGVYHFQYAELSGDVGRARPGLG